MHNEALSAQREPWISHTDVNLKMRKKRVMVPLGSDGLFHRFSGRRRKKKNTRNVVFLAEKLFCFNLYFVL